MKRYAYRDWDSVLASIGHGALKEGQVINKMLDERNKKLKKEVTDTTILDNMASDGNKVPVIAAGKSKSGIVVKGIHDLAVRFRSAAARFRAMRSSDLSQGDAVSRSTGRDCMQCDESAAGRA